MGYACLFALPFQCFFLKRYLWGPGKGRLFYKGAAAFFPVLISLAGAVCFKGDAWLLFAAALLCFLADIWIEYSLVCGVLVFLGAHLCFIFWMAFSGAILSWNLLLAVLFAVLLLWGYGKYLKKLGPTAWFLAVYLPILLSMAFTAFSLPFFNPGAGSWIAAAGAGMFSCSDLLLGDAIVTGRRRDRKGKLVMLLYSPAVFLLALSVFFFQR